jgi:hypothetical protein
MASDSGAAANIGTVFLIDHLSTVDNCLDSRA